MIPKPTFRSKFLALPFVFFSFFVIVSSCSESTSDDSPIVNIEDSGEDENIDTNTEDTITEEQQEEITEEPKPEEIVEEPEPKESQDSTESEVTGTIYLSGEETSAVGDSLVVGHIAVGRFDLTGNERTVILTDENTPIGEAGPLPHDVENNFIIVALYLGDKATVDADKGLSINISVDGIDYKLACALPIVGNFIECSDNYHIDFEKKEIVLDETTVININTNAILKMTGTVKWE